MLVAAIAVCLVMVAIAATVRYLGDRNEIQSKAARSLIEKVLD